MPPIRRNGALVTVANTTTYDAFPSIARMPDGDLLIAYRTGSSHLNLDGNVATRRSSDGGSTWGAMATLVNNANDVRGVHLLTLANGTVLMLWWEDFGDNWRTWVQRSTDNGVTFDAATALGHGFSGYAVVEGAMVQMPNGDVLAPVYGINTGDTLHSARVSRSTDSGATFADLALVASGPAAGRQWQEVNLALLPDGTLLMFMRSDTGTAGIYECRSTDNGVTWSAPRRLFSGTGRPSPGVAADGTVLVLYRSPDNNASRMAASADGGLTWDLDMDPTGLTGSFQYGDFVTLADRTLAAVIGVEVSSSDTDLHFQRFHTAVEPIIRPARRSAGIAASWA